MKTATATRIVEVERMEYLLIQIFTEVMDRFGWLPFMPPEHGHPAYGVPVFQYHCRCVSRSTVIRLTEYQFSSIIVDV